jgi:hypothetical protein
MPQVMKPLQVNPEGQYERRSTMFNGLLPAWNKTSTATPIQALKVNDCRALKLILLSGYNLFGRIPR